MTFPGFLSIFVTGGTLDMFLDWQKYWIEMNKMKFAFYNSIYLKHYQQQQFYTTDFS